MKNAQVGSQKRAIKMRLPSLFALFLGISMSCYGQEINLKKMELSGILLKQDSLLEWIKGDFIEDKSTTMEKFVSNHPFIGYGTNRQLNYPAANYSLFGINLASAYANVVLDHKFGLYLLFKLDDPSPDLFIKHFGIPENATLKHVQEGDYDFLAWTKGNISIALFFHIPSTNDPAILPSLRNSYYYLIIANAKIDELNKDQPIQ